MTELYFHEDDYCQIEILPISNWDHCVRQIGEIESFSEAHKAPDGVGWTEIYARGENPSTFRDLRMSRDALRTILQGVLPEFDSVYTGYGTYREKCSNTLAFGTSPQVVIFADYGEDGTVEHVWLSLDVTEAREMDRALHAFGALSEQHDLLLIDWGWGVLAKLNDSEALRRYLAKRIEVFTDLVFAPTAGTPKRRWWQFWRRQEGRQDC